jgi:hypothetical protein
MNPPFSTEQFLDVFRVYNLTVWPFQIVLFISGLVAIYLAIRKSYYSDRIISSILVFYWLWMGIVYHLIFFTSINKAAYFFGAIYVVQGVLLLYIGIIRKNLIYEFQHSIKSYIGLLAILYALIVYPLLGYSFGHVYPAAPTFGLPCPTTIFTLGMFIWVKNKFPLVVLAIPFLWSILGFSAAFSFGIIEDTGLIITGLITLVVILLHNKKVPAITNQ